MSKLSYRPDIDGLRALAVIPVVLYHLGGTALTGGYVGVDIFFVISGYLITSIILKEQAADGFSLLRFYERRIRRILPALFTVMGVSTAAACLWLFPPDLEYFGRALAATAGFGSNFLFWKESGYFEPAALTVPLLHTWSLAVEEQFYIFMPLVLMAAHRFFPRFLFPLIAIGIVVSLALCVYAIRLQSYSALFYLLPTRAWELLIGAALAFVTIPPERLRCLSGLFFTAGVALIFYAIFCFDDETVFPGPSALAPTLGAALVIFAGLYPNRLSRDALGHRIPVFFGKISYSLYLWHWPVMVFLQYRLPLETGLLYTAILFTASTALAWLSWRFVENPFRKKDFLSRKTLFIVALFLSAALIAGGLYISKKEGFPDRFPEEILRLYNVKDGMEVPPIPDPPEAADYAGMIGAEEAAPSFMVWGDSHAMAAIPGIDAAARKRGKRGYFVGRHSCMPSYIDLALMEPECNAANHDIVRWLEKHREIKTVILVGHWSMHETRFAKEYRNGRLDNPALLRDTLDILLEGLEKDNRRVVLMMDPPHAPVYKLPLYVARAKYYDLPLNLDFNLRQYEEQESGVKVALADLKQTHNFTVYDLPAKLCPDQTCPLTVDGRPIYRDDNHFSTYASKAYADIFLPLFD